MRAITKYINKEVKKMEFQLNLAFLIRLIFIFHKKSKFQPQNHDLIYFSIKAHFSKASRIDKSKNDPLINFIPIMIKAGVVLVYPVEFWNF